MIKIKRDGRFIIPEGEAFIGYTGDNLAVSKEFFAEGITDQTLVYRMYLLFDDGTSNFFLLDSVVEASGTRLIWNVTSEQIYKSGIVKMQIKASNAGGLIFHTTMTSLLVHRSIEFAESYNEKANSEFLQHEQALNALADRCEKLNETAESTLSAIRGEKPFSSSDLCDGCITRAKLDSELQNMVNEFDASEYVKVVDLGTVSALNALNSATSQGAKYIFNCGNPLAASLQLSNGAACEMICLRDYQILRPVTQLERRIRKILTYAPTFSAEDWRVITPSIRTECRSRFLSLEQTIGTLNAALENTLSGA